MLKANVLARKTSLVTNVTSPHQTIMVFQTPRCANAMTKAQRIIIVTTSMENVLASPTWLVILAINVKLDTMAFQTVKVVNATQMVLNGMTHMRPITVTRMANVLARQM